MHPDRQAARAGVDVVARQGALGLAVELAPGVQRQGMRGEGGAVAQLRQGIEEGGLHPARGDHDTRLRKPVDLGDMVANELGVRDDQRHAQHGVVVEAFQRIAVAVDAVEGGDEMHRPLRKAPREKAKAEAKLQGGVRTTEQARGFVQSLQ